MYSQNNEEEIILGHLKDLPTGRFLDIGAYDGQTFSNTLALAERGWGGVCIEPSPITFVKLAELHRDRPAIELVNAAIVAQNINMPVVFWDSHGDGVSTVIDAHKTKWEKGSSVKFQKFWIYPMPLNVLFAGVGYDFDFINLDVEGHSADLFLMLPLARLTKCRCICIEHDGREPELMTYAAAFGYAPAGHNGENLILSRESK
jgi:FkbM family methyltransferase